MLRKLIFPLVAAFALAGCGEGPTVPALEDPDGDPIEFVETQDGQSHRDYSRRS